MSTRSGNTETKYIYHGNPETSGFRHLLRYPLFERKRIYINFAIAKLRFMYSAKSTELIGDFRDAAIFRLLRSVTSL